MPPAPQDITGIPSEQVEAIAEAAFGGNLGLHLGPILLGPIFDCLLFGTVMQQFQTWWSYSRDSERRYIGYLTYWIVFASTCWTGMIISYAMRNFVYRFGDFTVFLEMPYLTAFPGVGAAISAPVQAFYTDRSYRLNNRNRFLLSLLCVLILGEIGMLVYGYVVYATSSITSELQAGEMIKPIRAWQCFSVATDLVITDSIAWGLGRAKTGWVHTDALIKKLMFVTLETQLAPTLLVLAFLVQSSIFPASTMGIFFDAMLPKAYAVGYLATLNTRVRLSRELASSGPSGNRNDNIRSNNFALRGSRLQSGTIQINTETYTESHQMEAFSGVPRKDFGTAEEDAHENLDYASNASKRNLFG